MTTTAPLERETILKRVNGIQGEIAELRELGKQSLRDFATGGPGFKLASYHLHRALEGVFHIAGHILSRLPGAQATTYSEIAQKLGEHGIVEKKFADETLTKMAKYRNRLVHFYADITEAEMYGIIQHNLGDFEIFLSAVKAVLEHPEKWNLTVEK